MRFPEDFFTTLLAIFFTDVREEGGRDPVLDLEIETAGGKGKLRDLFPFGTRTEVWMCADLCALIYEWGEVPTKGDYENYGGMKPDIVCADDHRVLFIENKTGGGREPYQEERYLRFLKERVRPPRKAGFFYSVPDRWTQDLGGEWNRFVREGGGPVTRGLIRWNRRLAGDLEKRLGLSGWFSDKLPDGF